MSKGTSYIMTVRDAATKVLLEKREYPFTLEGRYNIKADMKATARSYIGLLDVIIRGSRRTKYGYSDVQWYAIAVDNYTAFVQRRRINDVGNADALMIRNIIRYGIDSFYERFEGTMQPWNLPS